MKFFLQFFVTFVVILAYQNCSHFEADHVISQSEPEEIYQGSSNGESDDLLLPPNNNPPDGLIPPPTSQPPVIPSPNETGKVNSVQTIIDDMKLPPSGNARNNNHASVQFSGSYQQARKLMNYSNGYMPVSRADTIDSVASWCWPFMARDNKAQNIAVQVRFHEVYLLRKSTNKWVRLGGGRPSGGRGDYHAVRWEGGKFALVDEVAIDKDILQVRPGAPPRTDLVSYEMWQPGAGSTFDYFTDVKAMYSSCQMRLVVANPNAENDMNRASYVGHLGFDLWSRKAYHAEIQRRGRGLSEQETSAIFRFWGPNGRVKKITSEWQAFNVISMSPGAPSWSGLDPLFGRGRWTTPNPFMYASDEVLTEAQLFSNPPPLK